MALTERDRNKNARKRTAGKRNRNVIDLTSDNASETDDLEAAPSKKVQKKAVDKNSRANSKSSQGQENVAAAQQTSFAGGPPRSQQANAGAHHTPSANSASRPQSSSNHYESVYNPSQSFTNSQRTRNDDRESYWADEEDFLDTITSTQAVADNTGEIHHYGTLPTRVVGCQYYRGYASPGEQILLRREPENPYDSNAIQVKNVARTQIGHVPRQVAAKLAGFMDNSSLHIEGELAGEIGSFDCPQSLHLYGPDPQSEEGLLLAAEMKAAKLPLQALKAAEEAEKRRQKEKKEAEKRKQQEEKNRLAEARRAAAAAGTGSGARPASGSQFGWTNSSQAGPSSQPVMADILEASQRFNPREVGQATDQYGMQEEALKNMPLAEKPKGIKTTMLPYQLQALQWLLDQEDPQPPADSSTTVQLWKKSDRHAGLFTNIATSYSTKQAELALARGGILADDMGLGKTLEMISLILADHDRSGGKKGTTLIVAPLSVMSNWSGQIKHHVHERTALDVYTYHGAGRIKMTPSDFSQYDVVITTYQTLANDYMPKAKGGSTKAPERKLRPSGLYSMEWRRVILDEGHIVRNPSSKGAGAVTALIARSRWVLTGTPIVNSLKDLYSVLRFVGISGGLENLEIFNRNLIRPLKHSDPSATWLLKAIMTAFTLRRRKEMKFIDLRLPQLDEFVHRIDFTGTERERYEALNSEAQGLLKRYENKQGHKGKGASEAFQHLLEILLRMRQCCNHWQLCGERVTNLLAQLEAQKTVDLTPENKKALQDVLQVQIESQEDCAICLETLHNPVITTCGHSFGQECISKVIETQQKCPMCRAQLEDPTLLVPPANECGDESADDEMDLTQSSTKLEAMMQILGATKDGDKTIAFSQWTRFLDIVQARLDKDGYKYCRIDGTMKAQQRDAALQSLENDPDCTIMLASLGVCAVGLNLTAANQIILSDTWWAPAIEDQAVDRVHRLGQKKETRVFRLIMDRSIEESTIEIQQEKRKLMKLAFSEREGKRDKVQAGRLADIQMLLRGGSGTN